MKIRSDRASMLVPTGDSRGFCPCETRSITSRAAGQFLKEPVQSDLLLQAPLSASRHHRPRSRRSQRALTRVVRLDSVPSTRRRRCAVGRTRKMRPRRSTKHWQLLPLIGQASRAQGRRSPQLELENEISNWRTESILTPYLHPPVIIYNDVMLVPIWPRTVLALFVAPSWP